MSQLYEACGINDVRRGSVLCFFAARFATGRKNCLFAKTARRSPLPQTTTRNEKKNLASALPCSSRHYAAAGQIAITRWRAPTKLTGDPDLPLHNTPSKAICMSCFTLYLMSSLLHRSEFIDVSIVRLRMLPTLLWKSAKALHPFPQ